MLRIASFSLLAACLSPLVSAGTYGLVDNYVGTDFLSGFVHEDIADPTHGRVTYVSQATALAQNLTYASGNTLIMRADSTSVLSPSGPGRNSVRIKSTKSYTTHVSVFDIRHMPQGCGTWPAAWETNEDTWPNGGEVDISPNHKTLLRIEGVNDVSPNAMTLHVGTTCTMPASRTMTGTPTGNDCNVYSSGNSGCGVLAPSTNSYGPSFNANGGGWYAMERTTTAVSVWFWPRNSGSVPSAISSSSGSIDTSAFGTPTAYFPNTQCDINASFGGNNIIFDLTFCGDGAGISSIYNGAGCPGDCVDYVNNNPSAFAQAYWDVAAVRVYT